MPIIQVTDQFGFDVNVTTDILSSLAKYASNLSKLSLTNLNLQSLADLTLANPSITSLHAGVNFDHRRADAMSGMPTADHPGNRPKIR